MGFKQCFIKLEKHLKNIPSASAHDDANSRDSTASSTHSGGGHSQTGFDLGPTPAPIAGPNSHLSLLEQHNELKKKATALKESEREKLLKEEEKILASVAETKALLSFTELAKGIQYMDPIKTNWRVPGCISSLPPERHDEVRRLTGICVDGEDVPPPIASFKDMKLPKCILNALKEKGDLI